MDGDVSDDGYWQLQNGEWVATEKQVEALQGGAIPHNVVSQQQPPQMVNLGMTAEPMTIMMPQKDKSPLVMVLIIVGAIVGLIILSGILYAWASSLADQNDAELVGTWTSPVQTLTFESDGDLSGNDEWNEWRTADDNLYLVDPSEPEYEYYFRYTITDEVLFIAPLDNDDSVVGEDCAAFVKEGLDWETKVESVNLPSWCTPEE
jgi:hypothetical protein